MAYVEQAQSRVVIEAIHRLQGSLGSLQLHASNPYSILSNDLYMLVCFDTFCTTIALFRGEISRNGYEMADFLLSNVLSSLLSDTASNDEKKLMIDRFLYAPDPERPSLMGIKARKVENLRHTMERLQLNVHVSHQAVQETGLNPVAIHNEFDIVIHGIRTVHSFYDQVRQMLDSLRYQLDDGNISIETIQAEARWLATISADLRAFST